MKVVLFCGGRGISSFFSPLPEELADRKVRALLEGYPCQKGKPWFMESTFQSLLRLRGIVSDAPSRLP